MYEIIMCKSIFGRNIYVRFKFSCLRSSHDLCAQLRKTVDQGMHSGVYQCVCIMGASSHVTTLARGCLNPSSDSSHTVVRAVFELSFSDNLRRLLLKSSLPLLELPRLSS